jgi:hypothetical protein
MPFYEKHKESDMAERPWGHCVFCGRFYTQYEIHYTGAAHTPAVGETITGVSSGKTAIVESVTPYKTGGPEGTIVVVSPSGIFTDGESISGSTSGASFSVCQSYADKRYGFGYPDTALIPFEGKTYCRPHFNAYTQTILDKQRPDIKDVNP